MYNFGTARLRFAECPSYDLWTSRNGMFDNTW